MTRPIHRLDDGVLQQLYRLRRDHIIRIISDCRAYVTKTEADALEKVEHEMVTRGFKIDG